MSSLQAPRVGGTSRTSNVTASDADYLDLPVRALFDYHVSEKDGCVAKNRFLRSLKSTGLRESDPRLAVSMKKFAEAPSRLSFEEFKACVGPNVDLITKAMRGDFIVPDFPQFCGEIKEIYEETIKSDGGRLPSRSRTDPNLYGVSVCTINGQRYDLGDTRTDFCVQSCGKPITYAMALEEHGFEWVHKYVGREPSGTHFNDLVLNDAGLPHNPMISSGSLMVCAMIKPNLPLSERFDYVTKKFTALAGGEKVGFNNSFCLAEKDNSDRIYSLGYLMREKNIFPPNSKLLDVIEFYFQCGSVEMTAEALSVLAATLANGGICPTTDQRVFAPETVRDCLSLMYSCGMYHYSGEFAFTVGLPAKSGATGGIIIVIPKVMGICTFSPKLDNMGNSLRGIEFCKKLCGRFNFHNFGLVHAYQKVRRNEELDKQLLFTELMFAIQAGDINSVRRLCVSGVDFNASDYDGRTPLHVAASEGQIEVTKFILKRSVRLDATDRWGSTPLDDAVRDNHKEVAQLLREAMSPRAHKSSGSGGAAKATRSSSHGPIADHPPKSRAIVMAEAKLPKAVPV